MRLTTILLALALAFGLAACGSGKFRTYNGPEVTSIQVHKAARKMYLLHNDKVLEQYDIALGFAPIGHKQFEGDGKTPEGAYQINFRNPDSDYHLSLKISYPDENDRAFADEAGKPTGGDIFIHGHSNWKGRNKGDWTAGCIAVTDREMEVIYSMVRVGTIIYILP
ncbi:L,D-transpeptidase family protein [Rhodobacter ferrooxidans]|uniref:ErfK/YbiS/YcfS/YnhG family protein n=1 Tax=Rhodobacter ferrooxidans TaxID=371731 RepID=C8S249_9RHOB|nr:L,D-transpeptidase family protein [Rhodobacter sp. SW2]EEW24921.1 ErfK/YbiS/YcfS/YnhG family protein [Rhodobacter sp. SW2]